MVYTLSVLKSTAYRWREIQTKLNKLSVIPGAATNLVLIGLDNVPYLILPE